MGSDHFVAAEPSHGVERTGGGLERLTEREREVVTRAARGCANKEIAYDLGLAHSTVRVLMARAAVKLGTRTRDQLVDRAAALFCQV